MAAPFLPILTSIHGRRLGISRAGGLIINKINGAVDGLGIDATVSITSAQLLALNATPIQIVAAPADTNYAWTVERWQVYKPAGTAYAGIAAGEDLALKYTGSAGEQIAAAIETTGFLDQATAQSRLGAALGGAGATPAGFTPINAAVFLHLLSGEITTGTSLIIVRAYLRPVQIVFAV